MLLVWVMVFECILQYQSKFNNQMYQEYLYKQQLLNTFGKDNQLVDNVKLQLREKIIHKLKNNKPNHPINIDLSLIHKICNTLLVQYLENQRYFHTLAVFSPEANYTKHHFSNEQMQSMFRLEKNQEQSLFEAMIRQVMPRGRMTEKKCEVSVQTDDKETIINLQNRLNQVDFTYKQKMMMGLKNVEDNQTRFLKYKNDLTKRCKEELQSEINRIRNFEIANIRMQEQDKNKLKLRDLEEELQMNYRVKMQKLRQRQGEVIQRVTHKMKQVETYNFQARQRLLRDMQQIKAKEEELDRLKDQLDVRQRQIISKS